MNKNMTFMMDGTEFPYSQSEESFIVNSSPRPYRVTWNDDINPISKINEVLAENKKNLLLIDQQIYALYGSEIDIAPEQIFVANATESFKTMDGVNQLIEFLYQRKFTKSETLVIVGGGIIQDVGGFAAAVYKRGIKWVFFPTTLLAMCDSCIGAKTGINYQKAKNQIGLFSAPFEIFINSNFLKTLPKRDIASGLGEVLKLCITGGETLLKLYCESVKEGQVINWMAYKPLILSALSVKKSIIEVDEFERHFRKGLNYGHTLGHTIEALSNYHIPHGTAVVIGMMLVNELAYKNGYLSVDDKIYLNQLCKELISEDILSIMQHISVNELLHLLINDKKVEGNEIKLVMPKKTGMLCFVKFQLNDVLMAELSELFAVFCAMEAA